MSEPLHFKLNGKKFDIVDPNVRFGTCNAMALVQRLQSEQPPSVLIEFDGGSAGRSFLEELAADGGYAIAVEGRKATLTPG